MPLPTPPLTASSHRALRRPGPPRRPARHCPQQRITVDSPPRYRPTAVPTKEHPIATRRKSPKRTAGPPAFEATLWRYPGPGGWVFAIIPERFAPPVTHHWGRTPVLASVDGQRWETSVWRDKKARTLLAVPKRLRGGKEDGEVVLVTLAPR